MADVLEISNALEKRMSRQIVRMKAYEKLYNQRWFLVCELFYWHKRGK
jgi:hypothetical protein